MWNIETGELISSFKPDPLIAKSVIFSDILFSSDGKFVISAFENQVGLWEAATGKLMTYLVDPEAKAEYEKLGSIGNIIGTMRISPDGSFLATVPFYDGPTKLWEIPSGRPYLNTSQNAHSIDFSPDGRFMVLGGKEKTARVWNIAEKRQVKVLEGHDRSIRTVSYNADGTYISTADSDHTIVWRVSDWNIIAKISKGGFAVFSPAGNTLITSRTRGFSNRLTLWNIKSNCLMQDSQ